MRKTHPACPKSDGLLGEYEPSVTQAQILVSHHTSLVRVHSD